MAEIKMRVNNDKESRCFNCNALWKNTGVMYDLRIGYNKIRTLPLCRKCIETMNSKMLKAITMYNGKIKSQEDMTRIRRERSIEIEGIEKFNKDHMSINKAMKGIKIKEEE